MDPYLTSFDITEGFVINTNTNLSNAGKITCQDLTVSNLNYPSTDGTSNQAIVTDGSGNLSFSTIGSNKSYLISELGTQTTDIDASQNDHIKFDNVSLSSGSDITIDTTSQYTTGAGPSIGRITLSPNKNYEINCTAFGFTGVSLALDIWNVTDDVLLSSGTNGTMSGTSTSVIGLISPLVSTVVEIRFKKTDTISSVDRIYLKINEI